MKRKQLFQYVLCFSIILYSVYFLYGPVYAGEQGHYSPAPLAVRDYVMPPQGSYFVMYNTYYYSDAFMDSDRNKFDSLSISGSATDFIEIGDNEIPITITGTLSADFEFNVQSYIQSLGLIWTPDVKIMGADYGFIIMPTWGHTSVDIKIDANAAGAISVGDISRTFAGATQIDIEDDKTGFGDLYVRPLWLSWRGKHYDIGINYSCYAPIGAYDGDDIANVGLGFFTSQQQASFYYYPKEDQSTALMAVVTHEWHSRKIDRDVQPGQGATIEYGISQYLHPRLEAGVSGYNQWQITKDSGDEAVNKNVLNQVNAFGGQATWWIMPEKCSLVGKFMKEYYAKGRFEGIFWEINLTWVF